MKEENMRSYYVSIYIYIREYISGTGERLGSELITKLMEEYPGRIIHTLPSLMDRILNLGLNSLFSLNKLLEYTDGVYIVDCMQFAIDYIYSKSRIFSVRSYYIWNVQLFSIFL